jgi:hypothetical protein
LSISIEGAEERPLPCCSALSCKVPPSQDHCLLDCIAAIQCICCIHVIVCSKSAPEESCTTVLIPQGCTSTRIVSPQSSVPVVNVSGQSDRDELCRPRRYKTSGSVIWIASLQFTASVPSMLIFVARVTPSGSRTDLFQDVLTGL